MGGRAIDGDQIFSDNIACLEVALVREEEQDPKVAYNVT